jgi:hypothetical protein
VIKVRHADPRLRRAERWANRPVLAPERTIAPSEAAWREFQGLGLLEGALATSSGADFGVVRPLAWLPEHAAIVMSQIDEPTLRDHLVVTARPRPGRPPRSVRAASWHNAGVALRRYHETPHTLAVVDRQSTRDEVAALCHSYRDFLRAQGAICARFATEVADVLIARIHTDLPELLPVGTSHGDFVSRNIFTTTAGRVTLFDPMPLWRVPIYEDIARLLTVGLRLIDLQVFAQGLLFSRADLAAYERAFLHGYFGEDPLPVVPLRVYQLILVLDHWCQRVGKQSRRGGTWRRTAHIGLSAHHFRQEAKRLVSLLRNPVLDGIESAAR